MRFPLPFCMRALPNGNVCPNVSCNAFPSARSRMDPPGKLSRDVKALTGFHNGFAFQSCMITPPGNTGQSPPVRAGRGSGDGVPYVWRLRTTRTSSMSGPIRCLPRLPRHLDDMKLKARVDMPSRWTHTGHLGTAVLARTILSRAGLFERRQLTASRGRSAAKRGSRPWWIPVWIRKGSPLHLALSP